MIMREIDMINVITKCDEKDIDVIRDFESFFEKYVFSSNFEELDLNVMKRIDDAILLDKKTGAIKTKFGVTDILHLSTGCKVVLSYIYIKRFNKCSVKVLDVTECGSNALEALFSCADAFEDSETIFLLRHTNQLLKCSNRAFSVNGHETNSLYEGVILYG